MRVLLAIDDSKFSKAATQAVVAQYPPLGTQAQIRNVVDQAIPITPSYAGWFLEEGLKNAQEVVRPAERLLNSAGYTVQDGRGG